MTERYRLAPVRDARDREERVQRGNLAVAVESARATEAQVSESAARVKAARAALDKACHPATVATATAATMAIAIARTEQFIARLRRSLELAREEHARAVASHAGQLASLDAARAKLARARADREVIERHFSRWREERTKLAERRSD